MNTTITINISESVAFAFTRIYGELEYTQNKPLLIIKEGIIFVFRYKFLLLTITRNSQFYLLASSSILSASTFSRLLFSLAISIAILPL